MKIKNVFMISMDGIIPDYLNIFKKNKNTVNTKNLKKIAKNGIAFNNSIITNVGTPGSHASMITGSYPFNHGVRNNFGVGMSQKVKTIQQVLKFNNWITCTFVNHNHLTHIDFEKGSDIFVFDPTVKGTCTELHPYKDFFTPAEETTDRVIAMYNNLKNSYPEQKKFFFVHYLDPHLGLDHEKELYGPNIKYVDDNIGRLYKYIKNKGELDETLWVITSDHGTGQENEPRYELTGGLGLEVFDTSIKTPLIFSHPEIKDKGTIYDDTQVRQIDIVPTILDLVGVFRKEQFDGDTLAYYLGESNELPDTKVCYTEAFSPGFFMKAWGTTDYELTFKVHDWVSIRYDNSWKVCYNADDNKLAPFEVYDLIDDAGEWKNIIDTEKGKLYVEAANEIIKEVIPKEQQDVSKTVTHQMLVDAGKFTYAKNKHRTGMYKPKNEGGVL